MSGSSQIVDLGADTVIILKYCIDDMINDGHDGDDDECNPRKT